MTTEEQVVGFGRVYSGDPAFKPPLGLEPKYSARMGRKQAIREAIERYLEDGKFEIDPEWVKEYNELVRIDFGPTAGVSHE
jgi:hypothetical protein